MCKLPTLSASSCSCLACLTALVRWSSCSGGEFVRVKAVFMLWSQVISCLANTLGLGFLLGDLIALKVKSCLLMPLLGM